MHQTCHLMARIAHRIPLLRTAWHTAVDLRGRGRQHRCWREATSDNAVVLFAGENICRPCSAAVVPSPDGFADLTTTAGTRLFSTTARKERSSCPAYARRCPTDDKREERGVPIARCIPSLALKLKTQS